MAEGWKTVGELEWREWDGEAVAYCDASGDTFKVAPITRAILECLSAGADMNGLRAHVASAMDVENDHEFAASLDEIVLELAAMGVIRRAAP